MWILFNLFIYLFLSLSHAFDKQNIPSKAMVGVYCYSSITKVHAFLICSTEDIKICHNLPYP